MVILWPISIKHTHTHYKTICFAYFASRCNKTMLNINTVFLIKIKMDMEIMTKLVADFS